MFLVYNIATRYFLFFRCFEFKNSYSKMCVPTAIAVLSSAVAAGLRMLVKHHGYPKEMLTTALFCDMWGKWIHIMDSRCESTSLSYKNMNEFNEWMEFFEEFIYFIDSLQVHPTQNFRKDFQKGAILTTVSTMQQAKELLDEGNLDHFKPSVNGSGPCENFFSTVRRHNPAPTMGEFQNIMKCLSILRTTSADNGTYLRDEDAENWITQFKELKVFYFEIFKCVLNFKEYYLLLKCVLAFRLYKMIPN